MDQPEGNSVEEPEVKLMGNMAVVHCCCALDPIMFRAQFGQTRLSTEQLYIALWEVSHNLNIHIPDLAGKMRVSYVTAERTRDKIVNILTRTHTGDLK